MRLEQSDGLLYVRFDGLAQLGRLSVRLTIRDDFDRFGVPSLAGGPTRDEVAGIIWGPSYLRPRCVRVAAWAWFEAVEGVLLDGGATVFGAPAASARWASCPSREAVRWCPPTRSSSGRSP
ncbi:hypothetical protein GCM10011579_067550 [Streptomyces albiflavescens]|uniref:Uncharacterized protein n=1 Tax=Streptomyces albiflavescens TaxID=1623582 RepID=A0A917Y9P4_9ACTN|nr:hypothetical protein GCM10011579_067550 [Streptomyces albiflavescens]